MTIQDDFVSLFDDGTWSTAVKPTILKTAQNAGGTGQYAGTSQSALLVKNPSEEPDPIDSVSIENRLYTCDLLITAEDEDKLDLVRKNVQEIVNAQNSAKGAINTTTYDYCAWRININLSNVNTQGNIMGGDQGGLVLEYTIILGELGVSKR